jgi:hypothetical protein
MPIRKKSVESRTKRTRRKQSKFITPDLALFQGKLLHFVAGPDDPLREAERLRGEYAAMQDDNDAAVREFLQRAYYVADQFRRRRGDFERLQVHPFWKQTGQPQPRDRTRSKWVLYLMMHATTTYMRQRVRKYAVILDGLQQDQVEISEVAARIQELGGIDAAYEAMRARTTRHESCVTQDSPNKSTPPIALKLKKQLDPPTTRTAEPTDVDRRLFFDATAGERGAYYIIGPSGEKIPLRSGKPPRPPRKLNHFDRWGINIARSKAQLGQARTKEERDYLNQKIRVLEQLVQQRRAKALDRRLAARTKRRLGWKRISGPL